MARVSCTWHGSCNQSLYILNSSFRPTKSISGAKEQRSNQLVCFNLVSHLHWIQLWARVLLCSEGVIWLFISLASGLDALGQRLGLRLGLLLRMGETNANQTGVCQRSRELLLKLKSKLNQEHWIAFSHHIFHNWGSHSLSHSLSAGGVEHSNHRQWLLKSNFTVSRKKKHTLEQCAKANKLLGFIRRCAMDVQSSSTRRTLYLAIVRPALGYATQVWSPQTIDLIRRIERVQRRASKFILDLPFLCEESYRDRVLSIDILPICYWHEFLDLVFFFKATYGIVCVSHDVLPELIVPTRVTRGSASIAKSFRPKKCRTSTYQHSFFVRTSRIWNALLLQLRYEHVTLNQFKSLLSSYYKDALISRFDIEDPRTWKSVCLKCNTPRNLSEPISCCYFKSC